MRNAGRPVLLVPKGFKADRLGQEVLIGWNGPREAVRAAHDALTLLIEGDNAHIVRINDRSHEAGRHATSNDLAAAFARHNVKGTLVERSWERPGVAAALSAYSGVIRPPIPILCAHPSLGALRRGLLGLS